MDHYRVFISSTYLDNEKRRNVVLQAVERAGQMVAVRMERFTADDRPTVEVCRSRAADCELFVGIVARRYGWEPPGEEKSITWLEYEAARAAGRPCLMFEISPAAPFTEADMDAEPERWAKLVRFKKLYRDYQTPGVFRDDVDLGMLVQQALVEWRERREGKPRGSGLEMELRRYSEEALKAHGKLLLSGFKTRLRVPIDLEELYVPLQGASDLRGHGEADFADAKDSKEKLEREGRLRELSLLEAFRLAVQVKREGLVLLGEPGSGKTTYLKRLLLCCLKEGPEKLGLPAGMVPVFLPLRGLADPERETVDDFIERHLNEHLGLPDDFGQKLLERGNLLLLFDGLDEVANLERRKKVARWVERVLTAHSNCWPVVTCRFAGYPEARLDARFLELHIQPLREDQTERFVRNWYRLVEGGLEPDHEAAQRLAEQRAGDLLATLKTGDLRTARVAEMVGNPLLLANLCLVHRDHGRLPKDRRRLYDESVDVLLERWRERQGPLAKVEVDQAKRALQPVAEWLHQKEERTRASGAELEPVLEPALRAIRWQGGGAKEFLRTVRDESGLLTGWGPDQFGFMHLGFQEYLAASELRRRASEAGEKQGVVLQELARHYGESWWQEVLLLFVAMGNPSMFGPLMREVVKLPAFTVQLRLLGLLMEEAAELDERPFVELMEQEFARAEQHQERQQAAVGALLLMGLKDAAARGSRVTNADIHKYLKERSVTTPVLEVTERGGVELVPIPEGEFLMGSPRDEAEREGNEGPQRWVKVSPFWLGRFPVTNEQYGRFLKANPHVNAPRGWGNRRFNQAHQPVVAVTWDEARAFAKWAGGRLPTEAEWEYACRAGTTTSRYESDLDTIAWYGVGSVGPPPVGQKKPNAWGLHDMLGNVCEWCSDAYRNSPGGAVLRVSVEGSKPIPARVLRGSYWYMPEHEVRAARREAGHPTGANSDVGFRLARS